MIANSDQCAYDCQQDRKRIDAPAQFDAIGKSAEPISGDPACDGQGNDDGHSYHNEGSFIKVQI